MWGVGTGRRPLSSALSAQCRDPGRTRPGPGCSGSSPGQEKGRGQWPRAARFRNSCARNTGLEGPRRWPPASRRQVDRPFLRSLCPRPPYAGPIPQTGDERSARLSEGREQEEGRGRASDEAPGPLAWRPQWPQALSVVLEGPSRRARCRAAWPQAPGCGGSRQRRPRAGRPLPPRHLPSPCGPRAESRQSARLNLHLVLKEFVFPDSVYVCFNPPKGELRLINKRRLKTVEKNVFPSPWERNAT